MNEHKHGSPELPPPNHLKYWQMGTGNVKPLSSNRSLSLNWQQNDQTSILRSLMIFLTDFFGNLGNVYWSQQ